MTGKNIIVIGSYIEALVMDVPRLPVKGETIMGNNFRRTWGGKGSNQAVQVARLGADTSFVSMVGKDSFGDNFLKLMEDEMINSSFVFRHPQLPTASGFIICIADGHNVITIDIAALTGLGTREVDVALADVNENTIVLLQLEIPLETALYACRKAKEKGATVVLNPAPATNLTRYDLSCVDYLTPNKTEARICIGLDPNDEQSEPEIGRKLLNTGCTNVIITLGDQGSLLINQNEVLKAEPFKIDRIVDSTGAGDAFNGGFVAALSEGMPVKDAMRFGNATGALACTVADTIPSFHTRQQVEQFILKQRK
jgi:ribokinase